jgi:hypothetical protein
MDEIFVAVELELAFPKAAIAIIVVRLGGLHGECRGHSNPPF